MCRMKTSLKIFIGIIAFFIIFLICDIAFFYYTYYKQTNVFSSQKKYIQDSDEKKPIPKYFIKLTKFKDEYDYINFRPIQNPDSNENPVLIFGCSYAYGYLFDNSETISFVMSKYSARPIINRASNGWSIQHMLYQLKNDKEYFSSIKPPKYVFYVLMDNIGHFERIYLTSFPSVLENNYYLKYKLKNGKLVENKPLFNLYYNFAIFRHIQNKLMSKHVQNAFDKGNPELFDLFILHCEEINDLIKERWGNDTKFIILTFENTKKELWAPQLEKMGIDVIDIAQTIGYKDLQNSQYGFFEPEICGHPNGKIWELLLPKLKEKYPDL